MSLTNEQNALVFLTLQRMEELVQTGQKQTFAPEVVYMELVYASDELIMREALPERWLNLLAVPHTAETHHVSCSTIIPLPDDYRRFVSLKMDRWRMVLRHLTDAGSEDFKLAFDMFGPYNFSNPIAALISDNKHALQCIPFGKTYTLHIIKKTAPEVLPSELKDACVWLAVGRLARTIENNNLVALADEKFAQIMSS